MGTTTRVSLSSQGLEGIGSSSDPALDANGRFDLDDYIDYVIEMFHHLGEGAHVKGSVYGQTVRVSGNVNGQIEAQAVTLAKTAEVSGDVVHETLSIEAGAQLEGMCKRLQPGGKASAGDTKAADLKAPASGSSKAPASIAASAKAGAGDNGAEKPAAS